VVQKVIQSVARLKERGELRDDLLKILDTPEGERFFRILLRECHVTKPVFHSDDAKLRECEGRRRLAMSFLSLLGQDDPQQIINRLGEEHNV
jgi:hypothetical protein|tara:strand:- start:3404 stop:3679 length:276 start_codon:yes stop_codon:yes gene_type:complete